MSRFDTLRDVEAWLRYWSHMNPQSRVQTSTWLKRFQNYYKPITDDGIAYWPEDEPPAPPEDPPRIKEALTRIENILTDLAIREDHIEWNRDDQVAIEDAHYALRHHLLLIYKILRD